MNGPDESVEVGSDTNLSHFTMLFDTSPIQLKQMDEQLNRDPLVIK